jgi:phospholipid N-methyltransferase
MKDIVHFISDIRTTGAIMPSSRFLVDAAVDQLREHMRRHPSSSVRILELGPGTGVFTKALVSALRPADTLDVVELNDSFYRMVHDRFHGGQVSVHHMNVLDFEQPQPYDFIYSSIPYRALPSALSAAIWKKKQQLAKCDGTIIYYRYVSPALLQPSLERDMLTRHLHHSEIIWRNMPPAQLFTLQLGETSGNGSAKTNRVFDLIQRFAPSTSG